LLGLVLRRLLLAVPLSLGVATLVFVLLETAPGTPADVMLGDTPIPPEVRERIERAYGLDRPALQRYSAWVSSIFLRADLGWSHAHHRPVSGVLARAIPPTLLLAGTALLIHLSAGVLIGVVSAARRRRWPDRLLTGASLTLYAMPTFWLGLMAILVFSLAWKLFPAAGLHGLRMPDQSGWDRFLDVLWHLVLPASVLGLASAATTARYVRAGLLEALGREFVRAARARGVDRHRVLWVHALRNALLPVVNLIGLSLPVLLSGSLVIEVVFAWPGMGRLTYEAILQRDLAVVLASTLAASLAVIIGSLFSDVAMALVDPRVRLTSRGAAG
jgi:peptide/nickel transport system permease protein